MRPSFVVIMLEASIRSHLRLPDKSITRRRLSSTDQQVSLEERK